MNTLLARRPERWSGRGFRGPSAHFDGQRVGRDHAVSDSDVVGILR